MMIVRASGVTDDDRRCWRVRRSALAVSFIAGSLAALGAQQSAPPAQNPASAPTASTAPSRAVFKGGVEYVAVDVVVTDHNKPVTDLTADDFQILDGGRPQKIEDFQHISVPIAHRPIDLHAVAGAPPDVATNLPVTSSGRAFVFVLDDGATRAEDLTKVKRVMTQFLEELTPNDRVAVIFIRRSDLGQDFTSDTGLLIHAVNNFSAAVGWSPDARATRLVLANTVSLLADAPESRRAVIYVSSGFDICPNSVVPVKACVGLDAFSRNGPPEVFTMLGLQDLFDRARRADVPIYTLDPQGLEAPSLNLTGHLEDQTPQNRMMADVKARKLQDFVRTVASNTGGLAFTNTNDLAGSVDGIMSDNADYYVLGYSPSPYVADNKFHSIKVDIPTRRGLQIRGRSGYVASPRLANPASDAVKLLNVIGEAQPQTGLSLRAFTAPVERLPNGETSILTLDVTYPSISGDDDLQVEVVASDADGHVLRSQPRSFHVPLAAAAPKPPVTISFDDSMDLPRGRWMLIVGAESKMLGTIGTLHLPVDAEALGQSPVGASPMILGITAPAPGPMIANAESIAKVVPLQPTTTRSFSRDQALRVFVRVFSAKLGEVKTELKLLRGSSTVRSIPVATAPAAGDNGAEDCAGTLDLRDLSPGSYVLNFTAKASGKQTIRQVGFDVQ